MESYFFKCSNSLFIMKLLKPIRVIIALFFFIPIVAFFLDFTGKLPRHLHELLHIQWVPALLSLNLVVIGVLFALSMIFGRVYCSTICPLGVFQDIIAWKARLFKKKKKKFSFRYSRPNNLMRYSILVITVIVFIFGSSFLVILFDPYSIFGRIISQVFRPLVIWGNNGLALIFNKMNNFSLYQVEQIAFIPAVFIIAISFLLLISYWSVNHGRLFCNLVCPVGSLLGLFSKVSLFHISFDNSSCTSCGLCAKHCKSECIDVKNKIVDDSRCVTCFNCLPECKNGSLKYAFRYQKVEKIPEEKSVEHAVNKSRRTFLMVSGALVTSAALAKTNHLIGQKDSILTRKPIMPPGAKNADHFNAHCTACQLCVSKCPMQVIKPASLEYGLSGIMQPHLVFSTEVFCTYECNICSAVCPTGALQLLHVNDKKLTQIGVVKLRLDMCQVIVHNTDCGACAEHCPTQAVHMVPYKNGLTRPEITPDICIGCGACESICPVRPYKAIYVEGLQVQTRAKKPQDAKKFDRKIDNFGF